MYPRLIHKKCLCHFGGLVTLLLVFLVTGSFVVLTDVQLYTLYGRSAFMKLFPEISTASNQITKSSPKVDTPSRPPTHWIIPTTAPSGDIPNIPDTWGVFVPTEFKATFSSNCKNCYHEDSRALFNFLHNVTKISRTHPPSELPIIRKMATLLFLITQNTQGILQTSDHSSVLKSIQRFVHDDRPYGVSGLEYFGNDSLRYFDPYVFQFDRNYTKPCQYRIRYKMKPLWTVGVRCMFSKNLALTGKVSLIDSHSAPIFVSSPKFSIDTFSDSYFAYDGFWAMFASLFLSDKSKSRVWSLWAQRMLEEIEGEMAMTSLSCPPDREAIDTRVDSDKDIEKLFNFVRTWKCSECLSLYGCSDILIKDLNQLGYIDKHDVTLYTLWLRGLDRIGYGEPKRLSVIKNSTDDSIPFCVMHTPALITPPSREPKPELLFPNFVKPCAEDPPPGITLDPFMKYQIVKPSKVKNIAVIILFFQKSFYPNNIPILYDLYNKYFPNIFFCGPDFKHFSRFQETFRKPIGFIEVRDTHAFLGQVCLTRVIAMNLDVQGYLQFADDTLMNAWAIGDLPKDRFWFQHEVLTANRETNHIPDFFMKTIPWAFWLDWGGKYGKQGIKNVWARFEEILKEDNPTAKEIVNSFLRTLYANLGNKNYLYYQASDVFYVPARLRRQWLFLADIFNANNVFLEIAIPTMIYGLDKFDEVLKMAGNYLWYQQRPLYRKYYRFNHHFQHPWKLSWMEDKNNRDFMCYGVLGEIVKERTKS